MARGSPAPVPRGIRRDARCGRARVWGVCPRPIPSLLSPSRRGWRPGRTSRPPVPPHPAWPRARPLAPSVGRPCPAQVFASGQGGAALPRRASSEGGAPRSQGPLLGETPGEICRINPPPGPGPHADAGCGARPCSAGGRIPSPCPPALPVRQLEQPRGTEPGSPSSQPCCGVGQSRPDGRDGDRSRAGTGAACSRHHPLPGEGKVPIPTLLGKHPGAPCPSRGTVRHRNTLGTPSPSLQGAGPIQPHFRKFSQHSSPMPRSCPATCHPPSCPRVTSSPVLHPIRSTRSRSRCSASIPAAPQLPGGSIRDPSAEDERGSPPVTPGPGEAKPGGREHLNPQAEGVRLRDLEEAESRPGGPGDVLLRLLELEFLIHWLGRLRAPPAYRPTSWGSRRAGIRGQGYPGSSGSTSGTFPRL